MNKKPPVEVMLEKIAEQWKLLAAILGVVLVAVATVGLVNESRARTERAATGALYEAQTSARKAISEKNFEAAEKAYADVLEKHKGTRAAFEAQLQLGDMWMDAGNYEKATANYAKAASDSQDPFSKLLSTYAVGVAKETAGKLDEAVKAYEDALGVGGSSDFLRPEILMAQARCYEALNQAKKAIEIYKQVEDKYAARAYYSGAAAAFEKQLSAKNL